MMSERNMGQIMDIFYIFETRSLYLRVQVSPFHYLVPSHTCESEHEHPLSPQYRVRMYPCTGSVAKDGLRKRLSWSGVVRTWKL
jgi:hypothetical protein